MKLGKLHQDHDIKQPFSWVEDMDFFFLFFLTSVILPELFVKEICGVYLSVCFHAIRVLGS